jgi:NAD(P)-dependent dehydrogenase (short-subunit alcohol dehydrogenase family)
MRMASTNKVAIVTGASHGIGAAVAGRACQQCRHHEVVALGEASDELLTAKLRSN